MSATMACPRCGGDIEWETESVSNGDGPWAQSGVVGYVLFDVGTKDNPRVRTACGCWWTEREREALDEAATMRAAEGPTEP